MSDRDANTDSRYGAEAAGAPAGRGGVPYPALDCSPPTLEDLAMNGGWSPVNSPVPAPDLVDRAAGGMRGEPDMDSDAGEKPYPANGKY